LTGFTGFSGLLKLIQLILEFLIAEAKQSEILSEKAAFVIFVCFVGKNGNCRKGFL